MADDDLYIPRGAPEPELGTAGDFAKTFGAGTADVGAGLSSAARYFYDQALNSPNAAKIFEGMGDVFRAGGEDIRGSMNPETQKLLASHITSPEFWEHPVLGAALKATGMAPSVVALAIPGGLAADALSASALVAAGGGALNAGSGLEEFYKQLDEMPDEALQKQSPKYAALREMLDEGPARRKFMREAQGWAPALNFIIGAAAGAVGPAGQAARGVAGGAERAVLGAGERGALGTGALGAVEGAATNAVQGGGSDVLNQQALMDAQLQKEFDAARAANAAVEGGALGGLMGGAVGLVTGAAKPGPKQPPALPPRLPAEATDAVAAPQNTQGRTGTASKPVVTADIGNPQSAPTESGREGAKAPTTPKGGGAKVEIVQPVGPDAAMRAATEVNQTAIKPNSKTPAEPAPGLEQPGQTRSPALNAMEREQPAAPLDTGQNVPEQPSSLAAQIAQIGTGGRKAAMFPKDTVVPADALGGRKDLRRYKNGRGTFVYDPKLVTPKEIQELSKAGRENELLGLGPVSKPEAMSRAAAGETPVAVTERTPAGVEVKAAAGTDRTVPAQVASLEAQKTPGNVVRVETPENVLQMRSNEPPRTGRVLPNLAQTAETVPLSDFNANAVKEKAEPQGKRYSEKERAALDERLNNAQKIVDEHPPHEFERERLTNPEARDAVIRRAQSMVAAADAAGVKIQGQIKKSVKGNAASDHPAMQVLRAAKDLLKVAAKRKQGREITEAADRFAQDEALVRAGHSDEVIARRREEGDARMQRKPTGEDAERTAAVEATPESELAAKEGVEVKSASEEVTSEGKADQLDKAENVVSTTVADSGKGAVRGIETPEEERTVRTKAGHEVKEKVAKAASAGRVMSDEEKARIAESMGLKLAPAKIKKTATVDTNPSEAQKLAGNYKKGHRRVEGLEFTIENPKGSTRRGRGSEGEWRVTMPADYGYLRRTVGADGDHVDAYDGRSGRRYFIVDQLNERTGEFDEHKVMMRFRDEEHARETYLKAFNDGKGGERLGYIHEVTPAELKDWLNKGDTQAPHIEHVVNEGVFTPPTEKGVHDTLVAPNGERVHAERSDYLANELDRFDFSKFPGVGGVLAKFFHNRFQKLAEESDAVIHWVTPENMRKLWGDKPEKGNEPYGYHFIDPNTGSSHIVVRNDLADNGIEHGSLGHVVLHETAHAFTVREINNSPAAKNTIRRLMHLTADWLEHPDNAPHVELLYGKETRYAFENEKEFIAEAFSNKAFQEVLTQIPVNDPVLRDYLGLTKRTMSMWDVFRNFVKKAVEKVTGQLPQFDSALDAIMKVGETLTNMHAERQNEYRTLAKEIRDTNGQLLWGIENDLKSIQGEAFRMMDDARNGVRRILEDARMQGPERAPIALKLRTFDNIAQIADHFFDKAKNPIRTIHEAVEAMRVRGEQIFNRSEPIVRLLTKLRASNGEQFAEFSRLLHDATVANVHPDVPLSDARNAHLGKNALKGVWSKAQHPELAKRYAALPAEFKEAWHTVTKHYTDQQNAMSLGIIENQILKLMGIEDSALAKRIHEGNLTDADRAALGGNLDVIEEASELSKIEGPYVPLMRRGDHVVKADAKVTTPGNAKRISDNEFEFTSRKEAEDYVKSSPLQASIKKIWVDPKTGERLGADELDSVDRYRVQVQNRHVEFVRGRRAAEARASELAKDASLAVHKVVPRAVEPNARQATELSTALHRLVGKLEHSDAYKAATPTQRATLRQAIEEAALASHGSTRISSRALPRRGVQGYSEDLVQNTVDYAASSSRYLAKLEYATELEQGMKEMAEQLKRDHSKTGQYARTAISNEVRDRVEGDNGFQQGGKFSPVVKRAMSISFIDKLASPAYSVINAMQPGMVTMPYLAGKHGVGRSFTALGRAYGDVGAGQVFRSGLAETGRRFAGKRAPDDFLAAIRGRLSGDERAMFDEHVRVGTIDPGAGMEIAELVRDTSGLSGKADAVLGYLEGVTREMPRAVEAVNRAVTALAAYRLERQRGASHDAAVRYSKDAVNSTQFNYAATNSPALFNHPLAKIALQFKKYGQGMYQLIGTQIAHAIRNESKGDRARAVKTLITLAGTHTAMAGALGLPTEPFKYMLMGAHALGLTGMTWSDVEDRIRKAAANAFGKTGGEILTRGLPRILNVDLSRMGLDSVTSFGEPRSMKETDVKTWLFDSVAGPVVSLGGDWIKGLNMAASGDFGKAAEQLIPFKAASDTLRAYRQFTEGKKSASGRQTLAPYGVGEAGLRVLGFGSGREAESGAANAAFYRQSQQDKDARSSLMSAWVQAKPEGKAKAMAAITKFNADKPAEARITMKELTSKMKREHKVATEGTRGILPTKRDRRFLEEGAVYNTR